MSTESSSEDIQEAPPVPVSRHPRAVCKHCGSSEITYGLKLGLTAEVGDIGIKYEATGKFLGMALSGNEPLHLDICNACGTVARIYVMDTQRKWR